MLPIIQKNYLKNPIDTHFGEIRTSISTFSKNAILQNMLRDAPFVQKEIDIVNGFVNP